MCFMFGPSIGIQMETAEGCVDGAPPPNENITARDQSHDKVAILYIISELRNKTGGGGRNWKRNVQTNKVRGP
jgi:hypothetical protein